MARNQNSLSDRMEKKTLGETRLSRGVSSSLARRLWLIYCLLIVLFKILNVLYLYFLLLQFLTLIVLCSFYYIFCYLFYFKFYCILREVFTGDPNTD